MRIGLIMIVVGFAATQGAVATLAADSLPFRADELKPGERFHTTTHSQGNPAQRKAKDITLERFDGDEWTSVRDGGDDEKNSDRLIFGRPFYAMRSGDVVACWRNTPDNPVATLPNPLAGTFVSNAGNHLWIKHSDGSFALYAHAKAGSIPKSLCPFTALVFPAPENQSTGHPDISDKAKLSPPFPHVTKGELLGLVGASGDALGAHLHVHIEKENASKTESIPQDMVFERGLTAKLSQNPTLNGPWTRLDGHALPGGEILIWPPVELQNKLTETDTRAEDFQRLFDHLLDSGFWMESITCHTKDDEIFYDTVWTPEKGAWRAFFGLLAPDYLVRKFLAQQDGFHEFWHKTCDSGLYHAVIFRK